MKSNKKSVKTYFETYTSYYVLYMYCKECDNKLTRQMFYGCGVSKRLGTSGLFILKLSILTLERSNICFTKITLVLKQ